MTQTTIDSKECVYVANCKDVVVQHCERVAVIDSIDVQLIGLIVTNLHNCFDQTAGTLMMDSPTQKVVRDGLDRLMAMTLEWRASRKISAP